MTLTPIGTALRAIPRSVAASIVLSLALFLVAPCAAAPFDGTGTLAHDAGSYGSRIGLFWGGARAYRLDRIDSFTLWDRVRVQGDLVNDSITVSSIVAAAPFPETLDCGVLSDWDPEYHCYYWSELGHTGDMFLVDDLRGYGLGDTVLAIGIRAHCYSTCLCGCKCLFHSTFTSCGDTITPVLNTSWGRVKALSSE